MTIQFASLSANLPTKDPLSLLEKYSEQERQIFQAIDDYFAADQALKVLELLAQLSAEQKIRYEEYKNDCTAIQAELQGSWNLFDQGGLRIKLVNAQIELAKAHQALQQAQYLFNLQQEPHLVGVTYTQRSSQNFSLMVDPAGPTTHSHSWHNTASFSLGSSIVKEESSGLRY